MLLESGPKDRQGTMYLVQVGIGAFAKRRPSYYNYFLHLDTGSDLTWMQCHQCRRVRGGCFRQKPPLFPALNSSTYRPLPCGEHPLCFTGECLDGTCTYFLEYLDGANTYGFLASESLRFNSEYPNRPQTVENVVFGCGIQNTGFMESSKQNVIAGNFGLGVGEHSFLEQKSRVTLGRFSYCLPSWEAQRNTTTFLRFGADINNALTRGLKVTPLVTVWSSASYFVNLKGISVGKARLDIPPKVFFRTTEHGGCIVDSGTSITLLPPLVYQKMKETLIKNHFLRYKKMRNQDGLDVLPFPTQHQTK